MVSFSFRINYIQEFSGLKNTYAQNNNNNNLMMLVIFYKIIDLWDFSIF